MVKAEVVGWGGQDCLVTPEKLRLRFFSRHWTQAGVNSEEWGSLEAGIGHLSEETPGALAWGVFKSWLTAPYMLGWTFSPLLQTTYCLSLKTLSLTTSEQESVFSQFYRPTVPDPVATDPTGSQNSRSVCRNLPQLGCGQMTALVSHPASSSD